MFYGYLILVVSHAVTVQITEIAANKQMENVVCGLYLLLHHVLLLRFGLVVEAEQDTPVAIAVASVLEVQVAIMQ
jgi:hypothetical protein